MRWLLLVVFFVQMNSSLGQTPVSLREKIGERTFQLYQLEEAPKRKFLSTKNNSFLAKMNPLNYLFGAVIFIYQRGFSEQIQADCSYEISCSSYTRLCMENHGPVRGLLMGIDQLSCCFPGITDEVEQWRINGKGKVKNFLFISAEN